MDCPLDSPGQNTGVGSLSFLQGIFPTQKSNSDLLHWRWILYQLSYYERPAQGPVLTGAEQSWSPHQAPHRPLAKYRGSADSVPCSCPRITQVSGCSEPHMAPMRAHGSSRSPCQRGDSHLRVRVQAIRHHCPEEGRPRSMLGMALGSQGGCLWLKLPPAPLEPGHLGPFLHRRHS